MTTRSQPVLTPHRRNPDPLMECLIGLAGTPDDSSWITPQLIAITQFSVDRLTPVRYACITWPDLRDTAPDLGLCASLSVPLFAGRGTPIASLDLYGDDPEAMSPLTAAVRAVYDPRRRVNRPDRHDPAVGGGLVAGLAGAFAVRAVIQQAIGVIMADTHRTADGAYLILRLKAAETGVSLIDTAAAVIAEQHWLPPLE